MQTRYEHRIPFEGPEFIGPPVGMKPAFVYLLARHGERYPTDQRISDINKLAEVFKVFHTSAQNCAVNMHAVSSTESLWPAINLSV